MDSKNVMHVKLEFVEAIENKKQILSLEFRILQMLNAIKQYYELRGLELKNKQKINATIKKASINLTKLKRIIPKIETPKKIITKENAMHKITPQTNKKSDIEIQIQEIQERLKSIDQKF